MTATLSAGGHKRKNHATIPLDDTTVKPPWPPAANLWHGAGTQGARADVPQQFAESGHPAAAPGHVAGRGIPAAHCGQPAWVARQAPPTVAQTGPPHPTGPRAAPASAQETCE